MPKLFMIFKHQVFLLKIFKFNLLIISIQKTLFLYKPFFKKCFKKLKPKSLKFIGLKKTKDKNFKRINS